MTPEKKKAVPHAYSFLVHVENFQLLCNGRFIGVLTRSQTNIYHSEQHIITSVSACKPVPECYVQPQCKFLSLNIFCIATVTSTTSLNCCSSYKIIIQPCVMMLLYTMSHGLIEDTCTLRKPRFIYNIRYILC